MSLSNPRPQNRPEFIRLLRHLMVDRYLYTPADLYRQIEDKGPEGTSPSQTTIYNYFTGGSTPKPWFFLAVCDAFEEMGKPLTRDEASELMWAYFTSYG